MSLSYSNHTSFLWESVLPLEDSASMELHGIKLMYDLFYQVKKIECSEIVSDNSQLWEHLWVVCLCEHLDGNALS